MLILDTDHLDALMYEHERRSLLVARLEKAAPEHVVATTVINVQEKFNGWLSKINSSNTPLPLQVQYYAEMEKLIRFFSHWRVLSFDTTAADVYTSLKNSNARSAGTNDLKIAAIAICHNAILLTRNTNDFRKVPNLVVEDWLADAPQE